MAFLSWVLCVCPPMIPDCINVGSIMMMTSSLIIVCSLPLEEWCKRMMYERDCACVCCVIQPRNTMSKVCVELTLTQVGSFFKTQFLSQVVTFTLHKHFYTFEGEVSGDQNWVKILE